MLGQPQPGDAFGAALMAGLECGGRIGEVFEIVERDDGHVRTNDVARYFAPSWGVLDDWIYDRARGRVLDVGCGAGRTSLTLQQAGFDVVALDVSPGAVEVARRRGVGNVIRGTVHSTALRGGYDTIVLAGNNLGLLADPATAQQFLSRLTGLSSGAHTQVLGTAIGREPGATTSADDLDYEANNLARGRLRWQVTMRSRYKRLATEWFDYLFLTPSELAALVEGGPWHVADVLEDGAGYAVQLKPAERHRTW